MATELKRMTFTIPSDMEPTMDRAKKLFYDRTQSDMIRTLIIAGLNALDADNRKVIKPNDNKESTA